MISGRQIREGRKLVGLTASRLARDAKLEVATVTRAEIHEGMPFITVAQAGAIQLVLEAAGVEFIPENSGGGGGEVGVRLRKAET